jgi:hypothetical protein
VSCAAGGGSRLASEVQLGERYGKRVLDAISGGFLASGKYQTTSPLVQSTNARLCIPVFDGNKGRTWDMSDVCSDLCRSPEIRGARGDF